MWQITDWGSARVTPQWLAWSQTWHHQLREGKEDYFPWQAPVPWIQENQITFFIPVSELLPGLGTCSAVSQAGLHRWQRGPGMPCRANLTILKSFASKSGWHYTSCADVKLALKQAARKINVSAPICKINLHMPWGSGPFGTHWNCHMLTDPQLDTWHQC